MLLYEESRGHHCRGFDMEVKHGTYYTMIQSSL